jgi:hypothetical protein
VYSVAAVSVSIQVETEHRHRRAQTIKPRWNSGMPNSVAPKMRDQLQPSPRQ